MITEQAQVTALRGQQAKLRVFRQAGCAGCQHSQGCATHTLEKLFRHPVVELWVDNALNAAIGDQVIVGLDEGAILKASIRVYLWPLLSLFLCLFVGRMLGFAAVYEPLVGGLGLCAGFLWQRWQPAYIKPPTMLQIVPSDPIQA